MKIAKRTIKPTVAGLGLAALLLSAHATQPLKIDFSDEAVGGEPKSFVSVVGVWRIESDGNNIPRCLAIFIAQALGQDHFTARTSMLWAAS